MSQPRRESPACVLSCCLPFPTCNVSSWCGHPALRLAGAQCANGGQHSHLPFQHVSRVSTAGLPTCLLCVVPDFALAWNPLHSISGVPRPIFCPRRWLPTLLLNKHCVNLVCVFRIERQKTQYPSSNRKSQCPLPPHPCPQRVPTSWDFQCVHFPCLPSVIRSRL